VSDDRVRKSDATLMVMKSMKASTVGPSSRAVELLGRLANHWAVLTRQAVAVTQCRRDALPRLAG
jgi:hypothetical protein